MENESYIKELLIRFTNADADVIAVSVYDGKCVTDIYYTQLASDILKATGYFKEKNICKQHIALLAQNSYNWIVSFFAIVASGNIAVLMNPDLPKTIIKWQCEKADVSMMCVDPAVASELELGAYNVKLLSINSLADATPISLEEVCCEKADETVTMIFTSGTTGVSKIVEFSSKNLRNSFTNLGATHARPGMEKVFTVLPFFHIAGLGCIFQTMQHFHTLCLGRGTKYMFMDMLSFNPTNISLVPSILDSIVKIYKQTNTPLERYRYFGTSLQRISVGGASLKPNVIRFMMDQGITIDILYGMTETAGDGIRCVLDDVHTGTIGVLSGNMQCRIQNGEILLKSPSIMKGYYNDPEETAKIIEDGWLHTGDMGYCDADGYYYITGRKKNVIILSNGENVNPEEIEAKFGECEAILECMVYSDGKGICTDVFANDRDAAAVYIKQYNESMPLYRQVYKVNYTEEPLPKTGSGKIKRKENK